MHTHPTSAPPALEPYDPLLRVKQTRLAELLSGFPSCPEMEVFPSPPEAFRFRAEFSLWHENGVIFYAMHEPGKRGQRIPIHHFPIGSRLLQQMMPLLLDQIRGVDLLKEKLFEVEFLSSRLGQILITLIYHKTLGEPWREAAQQLKQSLRTVVPDLHIIGRSRGQKICLDQAFIEEELRVAGRDYRYRQMEGSFSQPNAFVNEKMLSWANDVCQNARGDLLELYCGNGNFTLPLSKNFSKVLATEVSKTSIDAAQQNLLLNNIHNINVVRLSSEEAAEALARTRPFRRLSAIDLDAYQFSTVLVDPPRAGLDDHTLRFVQKFEQILYISCNPETLTKNLQPLKNTHVIKRLALFDQFPYTHHIECGVYLTRLSENTSI